MEWNGSIHMTHANQASQGLNHSLQDIGVCQAVEPDSSKAQEQRFKYMTIPTLLFLLLLLAFPADIVM